MPILCEELEKDYVVHLQGEIDIGCSAELKTALASAISAGKELRVQMEATKLDVTAIQLLWAARRDAQKNGTRLSVNGDVPEEVQRAVREAGFEDLSFLMPTKSHATSTPSVAGSVDGR